ncbi:RNA-directed DNA polymerase (Reverse transcriptase) [Trifolium medium]|uniref:RNA-directed DNA polymerase (Reverse transcriptase) n=1 Tax=Trifolium medium TaxID=97028 RepID=A0A392LXT1_9FABA|nr:RNA-directed DNA polymerase (Reverse transcriptase) [Trifolium medium]
MLGFKIDSLPFLYLGVPIFKGKPKIPYFQPYVDKIRSKHSAWKASLRSIAGREFHLEWGSDVNKGNLVIVAWHKVCKPTSRCGLGIRCISQINRGAGLKLCWDMINSSEDWAILLKSRVLMQKGIISHHIFSSIWSSIKASHYDIMDNSTWLIGRGDYINFLLDDWSCQPLVQTVHISAKVSQFISKVYIPLEARPNILSWNDTSSGLLNFKDAFLFHGKVGHHIDWSKLIWTQLVKLVELRVKEQEVQDSSPGK